LLNGKIIVEKNENSASNLVFIVETVSGQAIITGTIMGNRFDSKNLIFDVDCFVGNCKISSDVETFNLLGGEHSWMDSSRYINAPDTIDFSNYTELVAHVLDPTETPTPVQTDVIITITSTSSPKSTPGSEIGMSPTIETGKITPTLDNSDNP